MSYLSSHSNLVFTADETAEKSKEKWLFQLCGENPHPDGDQHQIFLLPDPCCNYSTRSPPFSLSGEQAGGANTAALLCHSYKIHSMLCLALTLQSIIQSNHCPLHCNNVDREQKRLKQPLFNPYFKNVKLISDSDFIIFLFMNKIYNQKNF